MDTKALAALCETEKASLSMKHIFLSIFFLSFFEISRFKRSLNLPSIKEGKKSFQVPSKPE